VTGRWSQDEHALFLSGLAALGPGEWRAISANYVETRTPLQVASHAQTHFARLRKQRRAAPARTWNSAVDLPMSAPPMPPLMYPIAGPSPYLSSATALPTPLSGGCGLGEYDPGFYPQAIRPPSGMMMSNYQHFLPQYLPNAGATAPAFGGGDRGYDEQLYGGSLAGRSHHDASVAAAGGVMLDPGVAVPGQTQSLTVLGVNPPFPGSAEAAATGMVPHPYHVTVGTESAAQSSGSHPSHG